MVINKKKFAERMAGTAGISKNQADKEVDAFMKTLISSLNDGHIVKFAGIGKFELKTVKERPTRNPKTGEPCIVPEHKKMKFYASRSLADRMKKWEG